MTLVFAFLTGAVFIALITTVQASLQSNTDSRFTISYIPDFFVYTLNPDGTTYSVAYDYEVYNQSGTIEFPSTYKDKNVTNIAQYTPESTAKNDFRSSITSVIIPSGITGFGECAFAEYTGLTSITIGDSVKILGLKAFYNCTGLTSLTIGESVTTLGQQAFYNCTNLNEINYYANLEKSYGETFYNCGNSSSSCVLTIGDNVTTIPANIFSSAKIKTVHIPDSVTNIGSFAFSGCTSLTGVYITNLDHWAQLSYEHVTSNPLYYAGNLYLNNIKLTSISSSSLSSTVTSIGNCAFTGCLSLTSVYIRSTIKSIGSTAFGDCSNLKTVYMYSGVTSIGANAFLDCTSLSYLTLGSKVTSIGWGAFMFCESLTKVTIPSSVTYIGLVAFSSTSLTSVTFGNTSGWWYTDSETATTGTTLSSTDLADTSIAATYLSSTYDNFYWFRS